jgi:hypothetical protein
VLGLTIRPVLLLRADQVVFDVAMLTTAGITALATPVHPSGATDVPGDAMIRGSGRWKAHPSVRTGPDFTMTQPMTATTSQKRSWTDGLKNHVCQRRIVHHLNP